MSSTPNKNKIILIDGSSYLFRAFHALPPLTNSQGEPTGALYGVMGMLRTTLAERPSHAAFVLDASGDTFRNEMYPEYKANRPPMPDELREQIEPLVSIVKALGVPFLRVKGVEADDVIGTLAVQALDAGMTVEVSTSDKDFAQLVRDGLTLVNTMSDTRMQRDEIIEKFGVPPERIIDYLALTGDKVDNVPGVDKCGPKTAAKWLDKYGTLEDIIEQADDVGGKIGERLRESLDFLPLSKQLVTIKTDVALDERVDGLVLNEPNEEPLRALLQRYELNAVLRDLDAGRFGSQPSNTSASKADEALSQPGEYTCVLTQDQFDNMLAAIKHTELLCFDVETNGLDPLQADLVGLCFAVESGKAWYVPLAHDYMDAPEQLDKATVLAAIKPIMEDEAIAKVAQNGKFDMHVLRQVGIHVANLHDDTMLASFVLEAGLFRHDMDSLAKRHLNYQTISYTNVAGKGAKQIPFSQVALDKATQYAAEDADITLRLHQKLHKDLSEQTSLNSVYRDIEMPLVPVLQKMEANGVRIDVDELHKQSSELSQRMAEIESQAHDLAGQTFSLDSPKQLGEVLFEKLGLPVLVKTPKGAPSTNEEALDKLSDQHELPPLILAYRSMAKLKSTYTDKLPEAINPNTGRVHTSYHQAGAATGRLSSSDPNLQNIPIRTADGRKVRQAFIPRDGCKIIACDYSQIELRIMAHLSQDEGLLNAFTADADIHSATAAEVFDVAIADVSTEQRRAAKAINFGLMYGMSAFGLAKNLGIDRGDAQDYIATYFSRYPGVATFMDTTRDQAKKLGYVETVFGRRLHLPDIRARNRNRQAGAERAAINAPMQGTAADIIKRATVHVDDWMRNQQTAALMIMQVHDELVFECPESEVPAFTAQIQSLMKNAAQLDVPLKVDVGVGDNWDEAH